MDEEYGDVHTSHCCKWRGCKYGDISRSVCSVVMLRMEQEYPCEYCSMDWETYNDVIAFDPEWLEYVKKWKASGGCL